MRTGTRDGRRNGPPVLRSEKAKVRRLVDGPRSFLVARTGRGDFRLSPHEEAFVERHGLRWVWIEHRAAPLAPVVDRDRSLGLAEPRARSAISIRPREARNPDEWSSAPLEDWRPEDGPGRLADDGAEPEPRFWRNGLRRRRNERPTTEMIAKKAREILRIRAERSQDEYETTLVALADMADGLNRDGSRNLDYAGWTDGDFEQLLTEIGRFGPTVG